MPAPGWTPTVDTRLAVRYVDEDLVVSDSHVWTYLRLPLVPYEFTGAGHRQALAERIALALGGLVTGGDPVEVHLVVAARPVAVDRWAADLDARVRRWGPAPGWGGYLAAMAGHCARRGFLRKQVYLGVCLGARRGAGSGWGELLGPLTGLVRRGERALQLEDDVVSPGELEPFRRRAREVQRSLGASHVRARPAGAAAAAWLVAKPLHPAMADPPPPAAPGRVWGPGEVRSLAEGVVRNGHRHLVVEQVDPGSGRVVTGYTATLAFARWPDVLLFPDQEPWLHYAAALPFPVHLSSRLTLVPATRVARDVGRKLAEAKDQAHHIAETGVMVPLEVQEQYQRATALEYTISKDRVPWVYGRHRVTVAAPSEEQLHARARALIEHYRDLSIDVVWPTGDQLDLLAEAMPGDRVRSRAYYQRQELLLLAGGMPTATAEVGDRVDGAQGWAGPYIGETTSRVRTMVTFAPHVAMARNHPPGVALVGAPGAGKSFAAFTFAHQMALAGAWTVYIDPKADATPLAALPGLGAPRLFDLRRGNDGMLDPFSLGDGAAEATLLAVETLRLLLGGHLSEEREEALLAAVQQVADSAAPCLSAVVDVLAAHPDAAARNLGAVLHTVRDLPFARLCFAARAGAPLRPEDGLTVITLLGLDLPAATAPVEDYSYENRLAVAVMYLLTRYARRLMLAADKGQPKAICIDEAWALTSTPQGAKLIPEIARMGRSHNTALLLVSQNAGDLMSEQVTNSLSTVFAFRSTIPAEIDAVLTLLGVDVHDGHRAAVRELRNGECLMRDVDGRVARVQLDAWQPELFEAFNTNPDTRGGPR